MIDIKLSAKIDGIGEVVRNFGLREHVMSAGDSVMITRKRLVTMDLSGASAALRDAGFEEEAALLRIVGDAVS